MRLARLPDDSRQTIRSTARLLAFSLVAMAFFFCLPLGAQTEKPSQNGLLPTTLIVKLKWRHQAQFAGYYVAERLGYFAEQGLHVIFEDSGPDSDSLNALAGNKADIAIADLSSVMTRPPDGTSFTNVGQIFYGSPLRLFCRTSAGVLRPADIVGKRISVAKPDEQIIRNLIKKLSPVNSSTVIVPRVGTVKDLLDGTVDCLAGMAYNEYWQVLDSGIPAQDLLQIKPADYGIRDLPDGLFVRSERLADESFRNNLVKFVFAVHRGWIQARDYPSLAIESTLKKSPLLDTRFQQRMLDSVIRLLPSGSIGLLDLPQLERAYRSLAQDPQNDPPMQSLWTHQIWNQLVKEHPQVSPKSNHIAQFNPSTRHYVQQVARSPVFQFLWHAGLLLAAVAATLLAVELGYGLWGRLVIPAVTCLGGGTFRDLMITTSNLPLSYLENLTIPIGIIIVAILVSLVTSMRNQAEHIEKYKAIEIYARCIGMSFVFVNGAIVAVISDLHWLWVPFCAVLSSAGGGTLRDVLINREPATFRGSLFEEIGVLTGMIVVVGMWIANQFEHSIVPIYMTIIFALVMASGLQLVRPLFKHLMPVWLIGRPPR